MILKYLVCPRSHMDFQKNSLTTLKFLLFLISDFCRQLNNDSDFFKNLQNTFFLFSFFTLIFSAKAFHHFIPLFLLIGQRKKKGRKRRKRGRGNSSSEQLISMPWSYFSGGIISTAPSQLHGLLREKELRQFLEMCQLYSQLNWLIFQYKLPSKYA